MKKNAQAWSIDLVIGLMVFVLVIVIFYSLISGPKGSPVKELSNKAEITSDKLFERGLVDPLTGEFDDQIFLDLAEMDYETLKDELGIVGDFCLFIETNDDPATIKFISNQNGSEMWTGIGSHELRIGNFSCGEQWIPDP